VGQFWPKYNWKTIFCTERYRSNFNHCDVIGLLIYRIPWNNAKYGLLRRSRSFKVTDFGTNWKSTWNFLLVMNAPSSYHFEVIVQIADGHLALLSPPRQSYCCAWSDSHMEAWTTRLRPLTQFVIQPRTPSLMSSLVKTFIMEDCMAANRTLICARLLVQLFQSCYDVSRVSNTVRTASEVFCFRFVRASVRHTKSSLTRYLSYKPLVRISPNWQIWWNWTQR